MYNLAIIDDEKLARQYIISQLNSSNLNFASIIQAECGSDALQKFSLTTPDIMLVDIRMPDIDGLSLIKIVQEIINPRVKVIIISGYSDFEYSQKAIHLGVNDYLLKPIKKAELCCSLQKIIKELDNHKLTNNQYNLTSELVQERLLNDFLDGKLHYINKITEIIHSNPVYTKEKSPDLYYLSFVLRIINFSQYEKDKNVLYSILKIEVIKYFTPACNIITFKRSDNEFVVFICVKKDNVDNLKNISFTLNRLLIKIKNLEFKFSIGVGGIKKQFELLPESYKESLTASKQFLFQKSNCLYFYNELHTSDTLVCDKLISKVNDIIDFIALGSAEYKKYLEPILNAHMLKNYIEYERFIDYFIISLQKLMKKRNIDIDLITEVDNIKNKCCSLEEIKDKLIAIIDKYFILSNLQYNSSYPYNFQKILNYINENYQSSELSFQKLSNIVHMSQPYFCRIFKKITSKTFIEYVNDLRIEKAKALLKNSSLKVYEIAENVGYTNVNYFFRLFKKYTSLEPKEYRRKFSNEEDS